MKIVKVILLIFAGLYVSCSGKNNAAPTICLAAVFDNYLAFTDGDSVATVKDLSTGKITLKVKTNYSKMPICLQPVIDDNNNFIVLLSENTIAKFDIKTKVKLWEYKHEGDGEEINNYSTAGSKYIILSIRLQGITVLDSNNGSVLYRLNDTSNSTTCDSNSKYFFTSDEDTLYVDDFQCSAISAFRLNDGLKIWTYKTSNGIIPHTIIFDDYVFCGLFKSYENKVGEIVLLDKTTGKVMHKESQPFDLITYPAIYKSSVVYKTFDGKIKLFNIKTFQSKTIINLKDKILCGGQLYIVNDALYIDGCNFHLHKLNLINYKHTDLGRMSSHLRTVYLKDNKINFVYQ